MNMLQMKLGPRSMIDNGTLLTRNFRQFDALGLFKAYWKNNSNDRACFSFKAWVLH